MKPKEYKYKINGTKFTVMVGDVVDNTVHVEVNGTPYNVELDKAPASKTTISAPVKAPQKAPRTQSGEKVIATPAAPAAGGFIVKAPLPGTLTKYTVSVGDTVAAGATVCILDAMKMENDIHTERGGVVKQLLANVGDAVPEGGSLLVLE